MAIESVGGFLYELMEKSKWTFWPVHDFLLMCVLRMGYLNKGFPVGSAGKESACNWGRSGFDPWVGKIPWRSERLPTPVFWPGEFPGLHSPWGRKESDTTEWFSLYFDWTQVSLIASRYLMVWATREARLQDRHWSIWPALLTSVFLKCLYFGVDTEWNVHFF